MTIKDKIIRSLKELQEKDEQLYTICYQLHTEIKNIIDEVCDHLSKIQAQMPDYDKHDKIHSEKVIENIELLLQEGGINNLTLLEAIMIELCGYFHDTGMALPDWSFKLLEEVEDENYTFHSNKPITSISTELRTKPNMIRKKYDEVKDLFFCPNSESELFSFLAQEIWDYECYRMGLSDPPASMDRSTYLLETRQEYLRSTHGQRSQNYAKNISKKLSILDEYDSGVIAESVGRICCGHSQNIKEIQSMKAEIQICRGRASGKELTYNERYIAMLLRLGDVIHFSSDRTSRTLYAEHTPMNPVSDSHWQVKIDNLHYRIEQANGSTNIAYFAGFKNPQLYYFLHEYLDWVDDELQHYAAFVQDMEQIHKTEAVRYRLGLPTKVNRDGITALGYMPDDKLKFRLEQQKIVQLLMGMRLYSDEFMCLRELYQNALDACRCMRAQNKKSGLSGDLAIEFGLETDNGGTYLFCRDEGIGMTKQVVMNYLLRVGNSYYKSADFRRENISWENVVAPASEFGIGLLSCYMIGTRIEVITRHYSHNSETCWVCMEGAEDYGYFRNITPDIDEWVGKHGTIVKVYLKDSFKGKVHSYVPKDIVDSIYQLNLYISCVEQADRQEKEALLNEISPKVKDELELFRSTLYWKIQQFIHIPEKGIPVYILDERSNRVFMIASNNYFDFPQKLGQLINNGFSIKNVLIPIMQRRIYSYSLIKQLQQKNYLRECFPVIKWTQQFSYYQCKAVDKKTEAEAYAILHLPNTAYFDNSLIIYDQLDQSVNQLENIICIDGIPVVERIFPKSQRLTEEGILYNFKGRARPSLTINRESIREISNEVYATKSFLDEQLMQEISNVIKTHFENYPFVKTDAVLSHIKEYLYHKFDLKIYYRIMELLSLNVFAEYNEYGISIKVLLNQSSLYMPSFSATRSRSSLSSLIRIALCSAEQIAVEGDTVSVKMQREQKNEDAFQRPGYNDLLICATAWEGVYAQYDIVSNLWPIIPKRLYELYKAEKMLTVNSKMLSNSGPVTRLSAIAELDPFGMHHLHNVISRANILLLLNTDIENLVVHQYPLYDIEDDPHKKYVIYAYVNPRALSPNEEVELRKYASTPEYLRGVQEGWSILFYRYKDGYTIAPGIVDRTEMVKRIPREAISNEDGIQYCFTDGTVAF